MSQPSTSDDRLSHANLATEGGQLAEGHVRKKAEQSSMLADSQVNCVGFMVTRLGSISPMQTAYRSGR